MLCLGIGKARLGEPGDNKGGISGPLRRGVARLGEPFCLIGDRLRLSEPAMVQGLCLWPVFGWVSWPGL